MPSFLCNLHCKSIITRYVLQKDSLPDAPTAPPHLRTSMMESFDELTAKNCQLLSQSSPF